MSLVVSITLAALSFGLTETPICFTFGFQVLAPVRIPRDPLFR